MEGLHVELEVAGLDIGDQIEKEWTLLEGLSYDPKEDGIHIYTSPLDHFIPAPTEIIASEDGPMVSSILVKDDDGHFQIIKFRLPLMLGPAQHI